MGEGAKPSDKKKYRTREERTANGSQKKRGAPIELYMPVKAGSVDPESVVLLRVATSIEGIRDEADAKAVMHEKDIRGKVFMMRRSGLPLCRIPQTVMSFVEPKTDDVDDPEVN